ncbi:MAG TPA: MgtC/SapB family protein, partial [Steroidobacteraceae bacterium]
MKEFVLPTAVALGSGLLIGAERERSKGTGPQREIAGVRTFTIASLLGVFSALTESVALIVAFALLIGAIAIAGYIQTRSEDPGITTEVALLATFAIGVLSAERPEYSGAAAVLVTVLLAARPWLHDIVKSRITDREMHDGLLLLAAALIVLPMLP